MRCNGLELGTAWELRWQCNFWAILEPLDCQCENTSLLLSTNLVATSNDSNEKILTDSRLYFQTQLPLITEQVMEWDAFVQRRKEFVALVTFLYKRVINPNHNNNNRTTTKIITKNYVEYDECCCIMRLNMPFECVVKIFLFNKVMFMTLNFIYFW